MSKRTKESRKRVNSLVLLIAFTAILLIASTYAWFSTQKNVSINNLQGRVEVAEGLQISLNAKDWKQQIVLGETNSDGALEASWDEYDEGIGTVTYGDVTYTSKNYRPKMGATDKDVTNGVIHYSNNNVVVAADNTSSATGYMLPVSTTGKVSGSLNYIPMYHGEYAGITLSDIKVVNEASEGDYYAFDVYLMDTSKTDTTLGADETQKTQLQLAFASFVSEIKRSAESVDYGLQNCVRVAFALYDDTTDTNAKQQKILETTYESNIKYVSIWEPNFDTHSAEVLKQNAKLREKAGTANNVTTGEYNAISPVGIVIGDKSSNTINDVYYYDDALLEVTKTVKTSGIAYSAVNDGKLGKLNGEEVDGSKTGTVNLTTTNEEAFKIDSNKISKIRVYVWLEGQDPDCISWATHSYGINTDIVFCKDATVADGSYELKDDGTIDGGTYSGQVPGFEVN